MRKIFLPALLLVNLFTACIKDDEDEKCGPSNKFDLYRLGTSIVDTTGGVFNSYMEGTNRVFQWSDLVENVCPHEHVKANLRVALLNAASAVSARGRVDWNFFFEQKITMTRTGDNFTGNGEAGLSQAFGENKAWFVPVVEVFFPTKGSYSADTAFLKQQVISVEIGATYKAFKQ
jgi:hypothetical protein